MTCNATNSSEAERTWTRSDKAAREAIRSIRDESPITQASGEDYGRWAQHVEALARALNEGGTNALDEVWAALTLVEPELLGLVSVSKDAPLMGTDEEIRAIIRPGCSGKLPVLPSIDAAYDLEDLTEFISHVMVAKVRARSRRLAVCHAVRKLLLAQERLLVEPRTGSAMVQVYVMGDYGGIWPLSIKARAVQKMLAHAGLNVCEKAADWVVADLQANYDAAKGVQLQRYWAQKDGALYVSSGPTEMIRATLHGEHVDLKVLPNGKDGVYFASDAVVSPWRPSDPVDPLEVAAFNPVLRAPRQAEAYTPSVQRRLLSAWLAALVAGVRPLPILVAVGEKDGGKTTLVKGITVTINCNLPTSLSSDPRDLWTVASSQPVLGLDNVDSRPPAWFTDFLAATATGVAHLRRKLYRDAEVNCTDPDAVPVISTRTAGFARPDVAERTLSLFTGVFEDEDRVGDTDLLAAVRENREGILTHLVQHAVRLLSRLKHAPTLPCRFVDFAKVVWAHSSETAMSDLQALRRAQALTVGDAEPLIRGILECADGLLGTPGRWDGRPSELARELSELGAGLPHMSGKDVARRLREGRDTLWQFDIRVDERISGNNTIFSLSRKRA